MRARRGIQVQVIAGGIILALLLIHPFAYAQEPVSPESTSSQSQTGASASPQPAAQPLGGQLPDSPGAVQPRPVPPQAMTPSSTSAEHNKASRTEPMRAQQSGSTNALAAQVPTSAPPSGDQVSDRSSSGQPTSSQADPQPLAQSQQQQRTPQEPLGTAAAESLPTSGIAASRPAGAAVAPAKQRRVRSILIKVGVVVGAGVAIGTTMALSQGSPSKPPGSH
jgi:hypothetical protein